MLDGYRTAGCRVLHTNTYGALLGATESPEQRSTRWPRATPAIRSSPARSAPTTLAFHGPRLQDVVRLLADEGVDLLVFETCNSVRDAALALELRATVAPLLPLVVCASTTDGSAEDRGRVEELLTLLRASDDVEPGLNCCPGPHELFKVALAQPELPRWMKPSCGAPSDPVDDNVMAAFARAARLRGARWLGGCCGSDAGDDRAHGSGAAGAAGVTLRRFAARVGARRGFAAGRRVEGLATQRAGGS